MKDSDAENTVNNA